MATTFVNDLRLSEMGTGDESGNWGVVTNTNLELIGDALGYGTRAIANASTDNITIADGAADADRAMYLKLTGGGQACEVTLLPTTVSKVWMMENGTNSALTFKQGSSSSGDKVIIPAGDTKIIATDGGGGSGVVYDVLASLSVGDLAISGATTQTGISTSAAKDVFNAGMSVKNGSSGPGFIEFFEDSDHGTNKVTVQANSADQSYSGDVTLTLPSSAGTLALTTDGASKGFAIAMAIVFG